MLILLCLASLTNLSSAFLQNKTVECLRDVLFEWTTIFNNYFKDNIIEKHVFMIICGAMMDLMTFVMFIKFSFYGNSWRFPLCAIIFYSIRSIVLKLF